MDVKYAGKLGGLRTLELRGKDHFKNISKLGVNARKAKKSEAKLVLDTQSTA